MKYAASLAAWILTQFVSLPFMEDAFHYEALGAQVCEDWLSGNSSPWLEAAMAGGNQPWLIVVLIAAFYLPLGGVRAMPLLLAFYCGITAITPVFTYRIVSQLGGSPRAARQASWFVVFSPCFAFWAGALYKEGLIMLALNIGVYHVLLLQKAFRPRSLVWLIAVLSALSVLRFYLAIVMGAVLTMGLLLGRAERKGQGMGLKVFIRQVALVSVFVGLALGAGLGGVVSRSVSMDTEENLRKMRNSRDDLATASSGYLRDASFSTTEGAIAYLPRGVLYFLTVPWPWQFGQLRQNLVIPENAVWLAMYPIIFRGMVRALRRNFQGAILLVLATAAISCFYGLWIANTGTAYRLRIQVWLLWIVFIGWGLERGRRPS